MIVPVMPAPCGRPQAIRFGNENSITSPAGLLFEAIEKGDVEAIGRALAQMDRVDMRNQRDHTPLQAVMSSAAMREKVSIEDACQVLLALVGKGADPNVGIYGYGSTPLIWLVRQFKRNPQAVFDTVKSLLERGADSDIYRTVADHPIKVFLADGSPGQNKGIALRLLKLLLEQEPIVSHLNSAKVLNDVAKGLPSFQNPEVREEWTEALELLLKYGLKAENNFWSCLGDAIKANLPETFIRLCQEIPRDQRADLYSNSLFNAVYEDRPGMVALIFKEAAAKKIVDFSQSDNVKPQVLLERHMNTADPSAEMIRVLVKNGADPSRKANIGTAYSVLHGLCEGIATLAMDPFGMGYPYVTGYTEWLEGLEAMLEAKTINLDSPADDKRTPLMMASQNGHVALVRKLLEVGANPTLKSADNKTAADYVSANATMPDNKKRMILRLLNEASQSRQSEKKP